MDIPSKVSLGKASFLFKKYIALHFFFLLLIALYVFGFEYVPAQDYPNLLYQGHIFNQLLFHGNNFSGIFFLYPYIPPNVVSTIVLAIFDLVFDPFFSGKLYLVLLGFSLYWSINRYIKSFDIRYPMLIAALSFFLTFNLHYLAGYLNFISGLAFTLHIIATMRSHPKLEDNLWFLGMAILISYLCHFIALVILIIYLTVNFIIKKKYVIAFRSFAAALPTIILFGQYLFTRTITILPHSADLDTRGIPEVAIDQVRNFCRVFIPFHHFKWVTELPPPIVAFDYSFSVIVLAGCCLLVIRCILRKNYPITFWLTGISLLLSILLPTYIGGVLLPGERFVIFCLVNAIVLYLSLKPQLLQRNLFFGLLLILGIAGIGYNYFNEYRFNSMVAAHMIPQEAIFQSRTKQEGTNGFLHFHFYDDIKSGKVVPFFNTGIISFPDSIKKSNSEQ